VKKGRKIDPADPLASVLAVTDGGNRRRSARSAQRSGQKGLGWTFRRQKPRPYLPGVGRGSMTRRRVFHRAPPQFGGRADPGKSTGSGRRQYSAEDDLGTWASLMAIRSGPASNFRWWRHSGLPDRLRGVGKWDYRPLSQSGMIVVEPR